MQIDFHHAATYVIARHAGFDHGKASIVAYAAQYVDDATNDGLVPFENLAMYRRAATAHKMIDYRHLMKMKSRLVWVPFHFLPGNGGKPAGQNPDGEFIDKLVCKPNSYVAQDMKAACIADSHKPFALHRLGITAHVYVDTWAHQNFAGVDHEINDVNDLRCGTDEETDEIYEDKMEVYFSKSASSVTRRVHNWWKSQKTSAPSPTETIPEKLWDLILHLKQSDLPNLGHGQALSYPDRPYLEQWSYTNGRGDRVVRRNFEDFNDAADSLCKFFQCFIAGDPDYASSGLTSAQKKVISDMLDGTRAAKGEHRHLAWLDAINGGHFDFGAVGVTYIPKGHGSWKQQAVGTEKHHDEKHDRFPYHPEFIKSDWKMFHDAAKAHRLSVVDDILPRYGIVAA
jgi:hypothetical protein